ncbi:MAG: PfkB family carbohydrate kinase [Elusimicrobiales bacterium]|nr:PfkB family carbohydrate kinase [Elusimicrobiales bacterium]
MVVIFNLNMTIDKIFLIPNFKKGHTYRLDPKIVRCGGKGANVARALSVFSRDYVLMGFCCGYNGRLIIDYLKKESLNYEVVYQEKGESRVCVSIVDRDGVSTDINEEGPYIEETSIYEFLNKLRTLSSKVKIIVVSGRMPKGLPKRFYKEIFNILDRNKVEIYVDVTYPATEYFLNLGCHTLKINSDEFRDISKKINSEKNVLDFYLKYKEKGLKNLIVTDKEKKIIAICEDKVFNIFPPKIDSVICGVGAGDSFMAGFVYGKINNFSYEKSLKIATSFAVSDVLTIGAGSISKKDVFKFIKEIKLYEKGGI